MLQGDEIIRVNNIVAKHDIYSSLSNNFADGINVQTGKDPKFNAQARINVLAGKFPEFINCAGWNRCVGYSKIIL